METVRDMLNRKKRRAMIVASLAWAITLPAFIMIGEEEVLPAALTIYVLLGMATFIAGGSYAMLGLRCPQCRGTLGTAFAYSFNPFRISGRFHFCPYCSLVLDTPLKEVKRAR